MSACPHCSDKGRYYRRGPEGYVEWMEWAEKLSRTHVQEPCPNCGRLTVWKPKPVAYPLVRKALVELKRRRPNRDVLTIDWQIPTNVSDGAPGPWCLVTLVGPDQMLDREMFAIWKRTGALHTLGGDGAVSDDPIWTP